MNAKTSMTAILIGIAGAAAIIAANDLSTFGPLVLLPYGAMLIAVAVYLRRQGIAGFGARFGVVLSTFMVATVAVYVWILAVDNPAALRVGLWSLAWPLLFMLGVGAVLSAAIAAVTGTRPRAA